MYQKINRVLICIFLLQLMILLPQNTMAQKIKNNDNINLVGNKNLKVIFGQLIKSPFSLSDSFLLPKLTLSSNINSGEKYNVTEINDDLKLNFKFNVQEIAFDKKLKNVVVTKEIKKNSDFNLNDFIVVGDIENPPGFTPEKELLIRNDYNHYFLAEYDLIEKITKAYNFVEKHERKADSIGQKLPNYLIYVEKTIIKSNKLNGGVFVDEAYLSNQFILVNKDKSSKSIIDDINSRDNTTYKKVPTEFSIRYNKSENIYEINAKPSDEFLFYFPKKGYETIVDTVILPKNFYKWYNGENSFRYNRDFKLTSDLLTLKYWKNKIRTEVNKKNDLLWLSSSVNLTEIILKPDALLEEWQQPIKTNLLMSYSVDKLVEYVAYDALRKIKIMEGILKEENENNAKISQNKKDIEKARRKYGSKYVDAALKGDIIVGMPEDLLPIPLQAWSIKSRDNFANGYKLRCRFTLDNSRKLLIVVQNGKVSRVSTW